MSSGEVKKMIRDKRDREKLEQIEMGLEWERKKMESIEWELEEIRKDRARLEEEYYGVRDKIRKLEHDRFWIRWKGRMEGMPDEPTRKEMYDYMKNMYVIDEDNTELPCKEISNFLWWLSEDYTNRNHAYYREIEEYDIQFRKDVETCKRLF